MNLTRLSGRLLFTLFLMPVLLWLCPPLEASGQACTRIPASAVVPIEELTDRSSRIVLVIAAAEGVEPVEQKPASIPMLNRDRELEKITESDHESGNRAQPKQRFRALTVIENIKGAGNNVIYLSENARRQVLASSDYHGHRDQSFWDNPSAGRAGYDSDCRMSKSFVSGQTYLVFIGAFHVKGFELILDDDDRWLSFVRARSSGSMK